MLYIIVARDIIPTILRTFFLGYPVRFLSEQPLSEEWLWQRSKEKKKEWENISELMLLTVDRMNSDQLQCWPLMPYAINRIFP